MLQTSYWCAANHVWTSDLQAFLGSQENRLGPSTTCLARPHDLQKQAADVGTDLA